MTTAKKLTDNYLTCVICTEVFTDPATLQCNHTFCKTCLLKYTKTQSEAIQTKSIPCPSCRQQTKVTNPDSPVKEWVSQLKPSHVIQSLMDDFGGSPDVDACSVCKEDGRTTPGTTTCEDVFCDECLRFHKKMPLSRDHEVLDVRIYGNRRPKLRIRDFMCRIHKDEKIKLFCKGCKMAMCTVCCSIKHRKCDDVETIDAMMPIVKKALVKETKNQKKKIQTYTDNISTTNSKIKELTRSAQEMKDEGGKVRMAATDVLVRKEKELFDRIDKLTGSRVQELVGYIKNQEIALQEEQQRFQFIDKAVTSDCVPDMFHVYECLCGASRGEQEDKRPQISSIFSVYDADKLRRSMDAVQLGEVKVAGDLRDRTSSPVLLETIDFSEDAFYDLRDVVVFVVNGIRVITVIDYLNCRLSTHYVQNKASLQKHLQLPSGPMGMAKVSGTEAAVTLPDTQRIASIKFDPEPSLQSTVKTKRKYGGLAFLDPARLVAGTFDGPASLDILDVGGNVLKSINADVVRHPYYLHHSGGNNLIVSEGTVPSLVCETSEGKPVFTYTPTGDRALTFPQGITTTSSGDILFVDRDSHKVIQLTESGQFVRDVLTKSDGLHYPHGVCLDNDSVLYVNNSQDVKVYRFAKC